MVLIKTQKATFIHLTIPDILNNACLTWEQLENPLSLTSITDVPTIRNMAAPTGFSTSYFAGLVFYNNYRYSILNGRLHGTFWHYGVGTFVWTGDLIPVWPGKKVTNQKFYVTVLP